MFKQLLLICTILLAFTQADAMGIQPMDNNSKKIVVTNDGKEHQIAINRLADCGVITDSLEFGQQLTTLYLPGITSEQWLSFQDCLNEKFEFESTGEPERKNKLPEITRNKLNSKKRLHEVLTTANYLEHTPLFTTAKTLWSKQRFEAEDFYELPAEIDLDIAVKTINSTLFDAKLPAWVARGTQTPQRIINIDKPIWSCCINNPHTKTAAGARDGTITVLDAVTNESICWQAHTREVSDLHFSADGTVLFSVAQDGCVKIWDALDQFVLKSQLETGALNSPFTMQLNPQQTHLATDNLHSLDIWDLATGNRRSLSDNGLDTHIVAYNHTGSIIATGSTQEHVKLWDVATGECIQTIYTPGTRVNKLRFNASTNQLIAGGKSGIIFIWNLTDYSLLSTIPAHTNRIWGLELSPCSRFLFSCSADRHLKMWDLFTLKCIKPIKQPGAINDMRLTGQLELIIGCNDKNLRFIPLKILLQRYQERKSYFNRNITIGQANFTRQAFEADADEPIDVSLEKNARIFNQFPPEIRAMLVKELPIKKLKPTKKKRKTNDSDDQDFVPE